MPQYGGRQGGPQPVFSFIVPLTPAQESVVVPQLAQLTERIRLETGVVIRKEAGGIRCDGGREMALVAVQIVQMAAASAPVPVPVYYPTAPQTQWPSWGS